MSASEEQKKENDSKMKEAVKTQGGTNWDAIAALILGRTTSQSSHQWKNDLNPSIALTDGRTSKWSEDEDAKLKDAVQTHGGKDWDAIALLVPGRTRIQCHSRWKKLWIPASARRIDVSNMFRVEYSSAQRQNLTLVSS